MRSNALRKQDIDHYVVDAPESWEAACARIAQGAEAACGLPGNAHSADFEEFAAKYGFHRTSCFA